VLFDTVKRGAMLGLTLSGMSAMSKNRSQLTASRLTALWLGFGCAALMSVVAMPAANARAPEAMEFESRSLLGAYLAGRHARTQNDSAAAANLFRSALSRDPNNDVLLEQAFLMDVTEGNWTRATEMAKQLAATKEGSENRVARLYLGLVDYKAKQWKKAEDHFKAAGSGPIGDLTSALTRAWTRLAAGEPDEALQLIEINKQAEWAQFYLRYHRALIADIGGRRSEARTNYERIFKTDARTPRTALAYTHHAANSGDPKLAKAVLTEHMAKSAVDGHPMARALRDQLNSTDKVPLMIETPDAGLAEVFYGLGEALTSEGGVAVGAVYLQLALFMQPEFPFALAALANVHETTKRHDTAIVIYDRIPKGTPLSASIEIRKAINLNQLERVDEAKSLLESLAQSDPSDIKPLDALGNIMRVRKRFDESITYYSRAIALLPKPEKRHWSYWYSRGTSYERVKKWPLAEADLLKAMQLAPDEPMVLNYLGYSWIDQNRRLKEGMALIEKAVALKPDDGYIVDSLGWAHFKQGNFKDAVRFLERAVELRPEDPVLNDHLGDALWRVGREREARYQWEQSLMLKPEPEDAEKVKKKLVNGLASLSVPKTVRTKQAKTETAPAPRKRADNRTGATPQ
jgi:tetratricopeptide (TPR) repeat protein